MGKSALKNSIKNFLLRKTSCKVASQVNFIKKPYPNVPWKRAARIETFKVSHESSRKLSTTRPPPALSRRGSDRFEGRERQYLVAMNPKDAYSTGEWCTWRAEVSRRWRENCKWTETFDRIRAQRGLPRCALATVIRRGGWRRGRR